MKKLRKSERTDWRFLSSEYEHFKSTSGEGISEVFERYNKLINKLNLQEKIIHT